MREDYLRVTEVIGKFSGIKDIPADILKKAADRGSLVHKYCDAIIEDIGIPPIDDSISGYLESFAQWLPKDIIKKPERFYCDELKITGEIDGIYKEEDYLVMFDLKTPLKESSSWNIQLSAYAYLARKSGYDIKYIEAVKLDKTGKEPKVFRYEEDFDLFLSCLKMYNYFCKKQEPENYLDYL